MPHFLNHYDTPTRSCFAVMDEFGDLIPCNRSTWWHLYPGVQVDTTWF